MIEFIKEFGITFLCFFIGYSVVECVTGKEKKDNTANQSSMENQMPPSYGQGEPMDIPDDGLPF
jgi:hypothetical protein